MRVIFVLSFYVLVVRASPFTRFALLFKTPVFNAIQEVHGNHTHDGEFGTKVGGDLILTKAQQKSLNEKTGRTGLEGNMKRWPNKTVVYHIIESDFNSTQIDLIYTVMRAIENVSCVKFKPRQSEDQYSVIIQSESKGCYSHVGYVGKKLDRTKYQVKDTDEDSSSSSEEDDNDEDDEPCQIINLGTTCFKYGSIMHEMLHSLGFYHTQSIYNRDDYVKIVWDKIAKGHENNFDKFTKETMPDYGLPYDYGSIMHYPEVSFSINGEKTLIPLQSGVKIGQRDGMSKGDIAKLNIMYCSKKKIRRERKHRPFRFFFKKFNGHRDLPPQTSKNDRAIKNCQTNEQTFLSLDWYRCRFLSRSTYA